MTRQVFATFASGMRADRISEIYRRCAEIPVTAILVTVASPIELASAMNYGNLCPGACDLWIDSGAFTAWTQGRVFDPRDYLQRLQTTLPALTMFRRVFVISLDRIPGRYGRKPWPFEKRAAVEESIRNFRYLQGHGVPVVPVHHQGEPMEVLDLYLDEAEYVGISPGNDRPMKSRARYVQACWAESVKPRVEGGVIPPIHSFGNTSPRVCKAFPFYSADSTTWKVGVWYGRELKLDVVRMDTQKDPATSMSVKIDPLPDLLRNIRKTLRYEGELRELWTGRGYSWREPKGAKGE